MAYNFEILFFVVVVGWFPTTLPDGKDGTLYSEVTFNKMPFALPEKVLSIGVKMIAPKIFNAYRDAAALVNTNETFHQVRMNNHTNIHKNSKNKKHTKTTYLFTFLRFFFSGGKHFFQICRRHFFQFVNFVQSVGKRTDMDCTISCAQTTKTVPRKSPHSTMVHFDFSPRKKCFSISRSVFYNFIKT